MGNNPNGSCRFQWCCGTRTLFYSRKKIVRTHKFYQLHRISINWYLYAAFGRIQHSTAKSSILKNLQWHHLLCAVQIVLKCHFTIFLFHLFINCVAPEICLRSWTNTHTHPHLYPIIFERDTTQKNLTGTVCLWHTLVFRFIQEFNVMFFFFSFLERRF